MLKLEELIVGEIYYHKLSYEYIFMFIRHDNVDIFGDRFISNNDKYINYGYRNPYIFYTSELRLATQEERDWLNQCIKENRFVPRNEVINIIENKIINNFKFY